MGMVVFFFKRISVYVWWFETHILYKTWPFRLVFFRWKPPTFSPPQDAGPLRKQVVDAAKLLRCWALEKGKSSAELFFTRCLELLMKIPFWLYFWVLLESCDSSTVFIGTLEVFSCSVQWCDLALNGATLCQKVVSRVWVRMDLQEMDGSSHLHAVWNWHIDV